MFEHPDVTHARETNETAGVRLAIPDDVLDSRPHDPANTIRAIL